MINSCLFFELYLLIFNSLHFNINLLRERVYNSDCILNNIVDYNIDG
jgi:hypothetical protein